MKIVMYYDTACHCLGLEDDGRDNNLVYVDVPKEIVKGYFEDEIEPDVAENFHTWICEMYIADDMEGILTYAEEHGTDMEAIKESMEEW